MCWQAPPWATHLRWSAFIGWAERKNARLAGVFHMPQNTGKLSVDTSHAGTVVDYIPGGMSSLSSNLAINDVLNIIYSPTPENPKNKKNMHNINAMAIVLSLSVCGCDVDVF